MFTIYWKGAYVGISKRGMYNILQCFEEKGYIKKKGTVYYAILDRIGLIEQAQYIHEFMQDRR